MCGDDTTCSLPSYIVYQYEYGRNSYCCTVISYYKLNIGGTQLQTTIPSILCESWNGVMSSNDMSTPMGSNPIQWLELFIFTLLFIGPNICSRLCFKSLEGIIACCNHLPNWWSLAHLHFIINRYRVSLIWYLCALLRRPDIWWYFRLSIIGLSDKGICTVPHTFFLLRTNTLSRFLLVCFLRFLFSNWLFLTIIFPLLWIITSQ